MKDIILALAILLGFLTAVAGLLFLINLTATSGVPVAYRLSSGEVVKCRRRMPGECGIDLSLCEGGQTYSCQTNVVEGIKQ